MTASKDWNVLIWDLASTCDPPQRHAAIRFDAHVVSASFHPKNRQEFGVSLNAILTFRPLTVKYCWFCWLQEKLSFVICGRSISRV